jgi:hypothetical protein
MPKYTQEQFRKLYEKLPEELKEAIFSTETADSIWNVYERNQIKKVSDLAECVARVLHGVLPVEEFQKVLEKELKLKKDVAEKVFQEINRSVFFPVKESLATLYGKEFVPTAGKVATSSSKAEKKSEKKPEKKPTPSPKIEVKSDIYREQIEE